MHEWGAAWMPSLKATVICRASTCQGPKGQLAACGCAAGSSSPPTASSCSTTKWCWRTTARATKAGSCRARAPPPSRCAPAPLHSGVLKYISVVNGLDKLLPPLGSLHLEVLYMDLSLTMRPVVGPCDRAT